MEKKSKDKVSIKKHQRSKNPKVTVIIGVKNAEKYLEECIKSVLKQTLDDLEILFIYCKSNDNTFDIIERYQKNDERIVVINQEKPGIGESKNLGIENAKGEYFTFLDADDFYLDADSLEKMYTIATTNNIEICGGLRSVISENGEISLHPLHRAFLVGFPNGRTFIYKNLQYDYHFHSYIYKTKTIQDSDARFNNTKVYDDTHFFIRAMSLVKKFYVVPTELYCYRCHAPYEWDKEKCYDALSSLIDQLQFSSENNLEICHYITVQRINNEYGRMFEKYVKQYDVKMISLLVLAQEKINNKLLKKVVENSIDNDIIEPMNFPNKNIISVFDNREEIFILTLLYNMVSGIDKYTKEEVENICKEKCDQVYYSKTYRIGKIIVALPRFIIRKLKGNKYE